MLTNYANKVMDYEYNMFMSLMHVSVSKHLWDEHFTVIWANDFFYDLIGYEKSEYTALFHNHVDEYFKDVPDAVAIMAGIIQNAYDRGEAGYEFECQMPTKSGKQTWIRVTGHFTDELYEGIPVIYTIYLDITDLKEMQIRLEEALRMTEQANRAKSDFLSRMSHDIRTPMNAIVGMTEIASAHLTDPAKVHDCLKKISLSSQHLLGLINDVLDMSKIESGKMALNINTLSLPELIENIVTIIQPQIKEKDQKFSIHLHRIKHEHFYSDALRLRQVFINIFSNACKFTPYGGSITMQVEELPTGQETVSRLKFTCTDTGIGMKPEFIEHIFDAFSREHDSRVDKTEGTGLGMAIAKKIVEMLDGSITVESVPGIGSTFTVVLPMKIDDMATEDIRLPQVKILIVDDDISNCEYLLHLLKESGASAYYTTSGYEAVKKIEEANKDGSGYDAVILDWKMPSPDGVHTAAMIRKQNGDRLPILMVSAYDWNDIETEAKAAGVSGFLQKPFFRSTFINSLKRYLSGQTPLEHKITRSITYDFTGKTILLVEDNALNREIAQELLASNGAKIECAYNGVQAVEKFSLSPEGYYNLILMDIQMPEMDGYAATRKIRELARTDAPVIPILAMTADAFAEDIEMAAEAGMNGHLAKPLNVDSMNRTIMELLSGKN